MVVYCTAEDVSKFCQFVTAEGQRVLWGASNLPTQEEIEDFIEVAEEIIEDECQTAWGTRTLQRTDEYCQIHLTSYETSMHLQFPHVMPFDTEQGDKLELFDGNSWVDWIATYNEGRDQDFFVDYPLGKVMFLTRRPRRGMYRARATYRVRKSDTVPKAVRMATALQVGMLLLNSELVDVLFPEGDSEGNSVSSRIAKYEKLYNKMLVRHKIGPIPSIATSFIPVI